MADPNFEIGRPSESAIELVRVIERGLRESRAVDTEALCIVAGEKVWSIRVNIHIIDNGGNLIDCASISTIVALLHFRKIATSIEDSVVIIYPPEKRDPVPLSIHHIPICITFGFFDGGEIFVVDPNLKEELIMDGRMTLTMNSHREMCAVQKGGGIPITMEQVIQCARIAAVKVEEITTLIREALNQDILERKGQIASKKSKSIISMNSEDCYVDVKELLEAPSLKKIPGVLNEEERQKRPINDLNELLNT